MTQRSFPILLAAVALVLALVTVFVAPRFVPGLRPQASTATILLPTLTSVDTWFNSPAARSGFAPQAPGRAAPVERHRPAVASPRWRWRKRGIARTRPLGVARDRRARARVRVRLRQLRRRGYRAPAGPDAPGRRRRRGANRGRARRSGRGPARRGRRRDRVRGRRHRGRPFGGAARPARGRDPHAPWRRAAAAAGRPAARGRAHRRARGGPRGGGAAAQPACGAIRRFHGASFATRRAGPRGRPTPWGAGARAPRA